MIVVKSTRAQLIHQSALFGPRIQIAAYLLQTRITVDTVFLQQFLQRDRITSNLIVVRTFLIVDRHIARHCIPALSLKIAGFGMPCLQPVGVVIVGKRGQCLQTLNLGPHALLIDIDLGSFVAMTPQRFNYGFGLLRVWHQHIAVPSIFLIVAHNREFRFREKCASLILHIPCLFVVQFTRCRHAFFTFPPRQVMHWQIQQGIVKSRGWDTHFFTGNRILKICRRMLV
mmetsp:Transcript_32276/g.52228  ORF Transcript_32276/g.52228 Transcript_32276/m.52228 type:complete len:228 (-) Transcript_32276:613-1296(-)